jgi:membrane-associated phospholipid phosphatase
LHSAVPFVMAIALWKYGPLRWLGAAYAVLMVFSVVYLGEHYAVDGFAGWGVAAAGWVGARVYLARREQVRETEKVKAEVPVPVTEGAPQVTRG